MQRPTRRWIAAAWMALTALVGAPACAQEAPMPAEQVLGDVPYINGGAGDEEVQYIKGELKDYTLRLAFSRAGRPRAEYVASVAITINNGKGVNIFELASAGPYLLLKVPNGTYSVTATYEHQTVTRPVVASKGTTLTNFVWK